MLEDNPLGDPHARPLWVYLPPGYDDEPERRYPSVYVIQGLTGQLDMWRNRIPFRKNFPELADELFASGGSPPCILVCVDAWTSFGGSQFIDSPGTGRYHTYLCEEIVPFVDARYRTLADAGHRGIAGKSSGGYGAMVTPMLRPDLFGGLATHAGDALFEMCYLPEFRESARTLRDDYDGSFERFWEDFRSRPGRSRRTATTTCSTTGAWPRATRPTTTGRYSCRSTSPPAGCGRRSGIAGSTWDPVRMVPRARRRPPLAEGVYIDAGKRDEFYLDLGAEAFRRELEAIGVTDVFFELFDAAHCGDRVPVPARAPVPGRAPVLAGSSRRRRIRGG